MLEVGLVGKGTARNVLHIVPNDQLSEISERGKSGSGEVGISKMVAIEMEVMHIGSTAESISIDGRDTASDINRIQ